MRNIRRFIVDTRKRALELMNDAELAPGEGWTTRTLKRTKTGRYRVIISPIKRSR